jgi:hypothetical protein
LLLAPLHLRCPANKFTLPSHDRCYLPAVPRRFEVARYSKKGPAGAVISTTPRRTTSTAGTGSWRSRKRAEKRESPRSHHQQMQTNNRQGV